MRHVILVLLLLPAVAAASPERVLFVGNSFNYYNNSLHNHYRSLVRASLPDNENRARSMTISGGKLYEHHGLKAMVKSEDWDVVVLQGHSLGPIEGAEQFRKAAKKHAKVIRRAGAEPVLFMTWAYTDRPGMTQILDEAYSRLGRDIDADVAPVGLAFERVTRERPSLKLRTDDRRHPSLAGTYLAACVFYAVLHDRSPQGIDYDADLEPEVADYLQTVAWEIVGFYRGRDDQAASRAREPAR